MLRTVILMLVVDVLREWGLAISGLSGSRRCGKNEARSRLHPSMYTEMLALPNAKELSTFGMASAAVAMPWRFQLRMGFIPRQNRSMSRINKALPLLLALGTSLQQQERQ